MIEEVRKRTEKLKERFSKTDLGIQTFDTEPAEIPRWHSGSWKLDTVLGGGWPEGRLIEVFGPASSGKTTVALEATRRAQEAGKVCAFVDAEHSVDPLYAFEGIGVDREALLFQQPQSGEQAIKAVQTMVEEGVEFIVLDSVAALVPQAELDGDIDDDHVGLLARLMSQACRKLAGTVKQHDATVMFINQTRMKIGVMFGNPETTPGGKSLKFYSSIRLRLSPSKHRKENGETVGNKINARCVKNKTAPPHRKDKLMITYGEGLDRAYELRGKALEVGAVEQAGSWMKIAGDTICQGKDALDAMIKGNEPVNADADDLRQVGMRDRLEKRIEWIEKGRIAPDETLADYSQDDTP